MTRPEHSSHCTRAGEEHLRRIRERMQEMIAGFEAARRAMRNGCLTVEQVNQAALRFRDLRNGRTDGQG